MSIFVDSQSTYPPSSTVSSPSYHNQCSTGYEWKYTKCVDIDECLDKNGGCSHGCHNTNGAFYCTCPTGYQLAYDHLTCQHINNECFDGYTWDNIYYMCVDVDECEMGTAGCTSNENCHNTIGSFQCSCGDGFELGPDERSCIDKNECWVSNGGCSDICVNEDGSYNCSCPPGYELADQFSCIDINECDQPTTCLPNAISVCINIPGSFLCTCPFGYVR